MDKRELDAIPRKPGCYMFKDRFGRIIYIGKSKSLHNRVRQYFNLPENVKGSGEYSKYADMIKEAASFDIVVTETETDALITECRLIRAHKPKYNSMLKYSGPFPYIRIGGGFTYPLIAAVPDKTEDGDTYFGSFYDKYDAEKFIELLNFIWRTPLCGRAGVKPCLNYHLGKCLAPCGGHINPDEYHAIINEIITCMNGTDKKTRRRLQTEMKAASDILDFERASYLRDCIIALNKLERRRRSLFTDMKGQNVYLFLRAYNEPRFSLFYISDGITVNRADFNNLTGPHEDRIIAFVAENGGLNAADNRDNWDNAYIDDNADSIASGAELTACLLSIGADKYFVPVGEGGDTGKAVKKVIVGFNKWKTSGDDKLVLL